MKLERYDSLDGIRVLSMIGILVMHVLANAPYKSELASLYSYVVSFGDFTALFMLISGFSVSCGYYDKIREGAFKDINAFYKKRYVKILPFFVFLSVVDIVLSYSRGSLYEAIANSTLAFGLIPHEHISVIGVGWTLGVIFVFYLLYPFFVFCMQSKMRMILLYIVSCFFAFVSNDYFGLGKVDFLFCLIYFVTGCGAYLLRYRLKKINRIVVILLLFATGIPFFSLPSFHDVFKYLFFVIILVYGLISSDEKSLLHGKVMSVINSYSFEIYLCHMVAYRIIEKLKMACLFDNSYISYFVACCLTFMIAFGIAFGFKKIEKIVMKRVVNG